ncbi:Spy/CpxP family protein refolding chaperone [Reichenbachiella ulvae]|uniref:Periplasmic heavy metal sensor n=1 Tax=Reichenbachiella ulvae TaxID=2980104 RepID=A0ABT3D0C1_9BACT|nr:periplasmic heavy metal sensor [Reichenbachiella ulvae]MCV9388903.1 periplasmic heavy metal sensor [Reichenbachiella ulvae]
MKNKMIITALAILLVSGSAWAQCPGQANGPRGGLKTNRMGTPIERMAYRLDLSEVQQQKIEDIHLTYAKKNQPLRNEVNELQARLQTLTTTDSPDKKEIESTVAQISDARETLMLNRTLCQLDIRSELDESQKLRFDQMKSEKGRGNFKRGR